MINLQKTVLLGLAIFTLLVGCSDISQSNYDAVIWQAQKGKVVKDNPRAAMVSSLEQDHLKKGMSRDEVRELLGRPDEIKNDIDLYDIGVSSYGVDMEVYQLTYKEEKLISFHVSRY